MGATQSSQLLKECTQTLQTQPLTFESDFWPAFFEIPMTIDDVWIYFSFDEIRTIKMKMPQNLFILIQHCISKLGVVVYANMDLPQGSGQQKIVLNIIRLLTRVLGVVMENVDDQFQQRIWRVDDPDTSNQRVRQPQSIGEKLVQRLTYLLFVQGYTLTDTGSPVDPATHTVYAYREQQTSTMETPLSPSSSSSSSLSSSSSTKSATETKGNDTGNDDESHVLHTQSHQSHSQSPVAHTVALGRLWESGIGIPAQPYDSTPSYVDENRTEILKCLLVTDHRETLVNVSLQLLLITLDHKSHHGVNSKALNDNNIVRDLCYRLVVLKRKRLKHTGVAQSKTIATQMKMAKATSKSAQISVSNTNNGKTRNLSTTDSSNTNINANPQITTMKLTVEQVNANGDNGKRVSVNTVQYVDDLDYNIAVFANLTDLLHIGVASHQSYLPAAQKQLAFYQEVYILWWKLVIESKSFSDYCINVVGNSSVKGEEGTAFERLIRPLLFYLIRSLRDPSKVGFLYCCVFILLRFSGDRDFCVKLNTPYPGNLPLELVTAELGFTLDKAESLTYADLVVAACHDLVHHTIPAPDVLMASSCPAILDSLYNVVLTVLANISPYTTRLSHISAYKLVSLFKIFGDPAFLQLTDNNRHLVFLCTDIFNNIIQYQYSGNTTVVHAMIRRYKIFLNLLSFVASSPSNSKTVSTAASTGAPTVATVAPAAASASASSVTATTTATSTTATSTTATSTTATSTTATSTIALDHDMAARIVWMGELELRLDTVRRVLHYFLEPVEVMDAVDVDDKGVESKRLKYKIKNKHVTFETVAISTLVGILPLPHQIIVRRYIPNVHTSLWFTTYLWGIIFLRSQIHPLFDVNALKLFVVQGGR